MPPARNSKDFDSVSFKFFCNVKSKLLIPGPEKNRRPLLPIVLAIVLPTAGSSAGKLKSDGVEVRLSIARVVIQIERAGV